MLPCWPRATKLSREVDRYDPSGGLPFSAFARWWLERAMREVELDTARVLGLELARQQHREEKAVAKLRHPCTPGDLSHLKEL